MTGDGTGPTRRRLLEAIGGTTVAVGLAGCSGDGGDAGGDGDDTDDTETPDETTADETTTEATTTEATTTAETTGDGGGGDGSGSPEGVHTPGPNDDHDWAKIAEMEKVGTFDAPEEAPTSFGFSRVNSEMTVSYGSLAGSETAESGTVYVVLLVDGSVENVVVWETPIENGAEFEVSPNGGVVQMDAQEVTKMVFAWENAEGEMYVVEKEDFEF